MTDRQYDDNSPQKCGKIDNRDKNSWLTYHWCNPAAEERSFLGCSNKLSFPHRRMPHWCHPYLAPLCHTWTLRKTSKDNEQESPPIGSAGQNATPCPNYNTPNWFVFDVDPKFDNATNDCQQCTAWHIGQFSQSATNLVTPAQYWSNPAYAIHSRETATVLSTHLISPGIGISGFQL